MSWKETVDAALNGRHPKLGRSIEFTLLAVVGISVVQMGVETMPDLPRWASRALAVSEIVVVVIFSVEYALRLLTAPSRLRYARSFYGVVDFLSIVPFLIALLVPGLWLDLRAVRAFRLFRLARLLKLARYTSATDRLLAAIREVREEIIVFGVMSLGVLYACALVIYQFEHDAQPEAFRSVFDAMWWAAVTLTTVGYGDIYPVTALGRLFTVVMLFVALGIIAVPTGLVASALTALREKKNSTDEEKDG